VASGERREPAAVESFRRKNDGLRQRIAKRPGEARTLAANLRVTSLANSSGKAFASEGKGSITVLETRVDHCCVHDWFRPPLKISCVNHGDIGTSRPVQQTLKVLAAIKKLI